MTAARSKEDDAIHYLKNQLSIILGFAELLAEDLERDDPKRHDVDEIRTAARAALDCLPGLGLRITEGTIR